MSLERINKELTKHFEQYDEKTIQKIIHSVSLDDKHCVRIQPSIVLNNQPKNLQFTRGKSYRQFIKNMRKHGLFVFTNIDEYKVNKLGTLSKIGTISERQLNETREIPDLREFHFSTYNLANRAGTLMKDIAFYQYYLKYQTKG